MKRVSVVGSSGSGKTTVARELADALGVPHVELDALHWGENWTAATSAELSERVRAATTGDGWVVDGNYWSKIGPRSGRGPTPWSGSARRAGVPPGSP